MPSAATASPVIVVKPVHTTVCSPSAEISITSGAKLVVGEGPADAFRLPDVAGVSVVPGLADGHRCERCWKVLPEVGSNAKPLCRRCDDAVST